MDNPSYTIIVGDEQDTRARDDATDVPHDNLVPNDIGHGLAISNHHNGIPGSPKRPNRSMSDGLMEIQGRPSLVLDATKLVNIEQARLECEGLIDEKPGQNGHPKLLVDRSVFSQKHFDENYDAGTRPSPTIREQMRKKISKCTCNARCFKDFLFTVFPFINIMKNYNIREDLSGDIVSGLTVGIMHIPQGMAYGMLTTLPPVYGLYMSFFPVVVYFFFGSSKHISIGTFAVACLMVGSAVQKGYDSVSGTLTSPVQTTTDSSIAGNLSNVTSNILGEEKVSMSAEELDIRLQFAMSVTFLVGVVQLLMGFFRLGFITVYLSDPLISGFTTGAACHVFTSQIKHVFGISTARYSGAFKLIYTYQEFFGNLDQTNAITLIISVICMVILYCTGRFINNNPKLKPKMFMPVPIELIVVVLGTVISYLINLEEKFNVIVVDDIPTGLPVPSTRNFSRIGEVLSDAIALAIVIFAISISMAKILAKKHNYEVNANQELISFGIATVVSSFFSSSAPSASLSRSLVQERVGGRTQVAGMVSCCLLLVVLLAIGPYFRTLPNCILAATIVVALEGLFRQVFELPVLWQQSKIDFCVLASIIIVALRGMFLQVLDLKRLWRVSVIDFFVWIVAFLATVVLDVDLGLGVAVIFAILTVVARSQQPYACLLGQMPGTDIYRDLNVYHEAKEMEGLKIFRFEQSLFFVNLEHFRMCLYKKTCDPRQLKIKQKKRDAKLQKQLKKANKGLSAVVADPDDQMNMELEINGKNGEVKINVIDAMLPSDTDFHTIILDCSPWSFVDSMAVKVLTSVIQEFKQVGVKVCLVNCKSGIREMFTRTKFYETLDHSCIYISIHDAVLHSQHTESPQTRAKTTDGEGQDIIDEITKTWKHADSTLDTDEEA